MNKLSSSLLQSSKVCRTTSIQQLKRNYCKPGVDPWFEKSAYSWFLPVQTRWKDNDQYHHLNNAVYHAIFDSVINVHLIRHIGLDIYSSSTPLGYMITGNCTFLGSARYPEVYMAGLGIHKIGKTSLQYKLALFPPIKEGENMLVNLVNGHEHTDPLLDKFGERGLVLGDYAHVFVDPETKRPTPMNQEWIPDLKKLLIRT
eukprot:TRINITY_DN3345_c0_g1_i8.p1 TRINITY_DN3345_c0_g1~~TRINITY_DN3345_c0_g1_i8.p1  ORF type:complete len:201 (+),score=24.89 TRINITY_DN3345_c0_g1_i8:24-626(+)